MNVTRRGFLQALAGLGAAAMAPAIVRAENIMRVRPIITPSLEECWVYGAQLDGNMGGLDVGRAIFAVFIKRNEQEGWVRKSVNVRRDSPVGITPDGRIITPQEDATWRGWDSIGLDRKTLDANATKIRGHRDAAIYPGKDSLIIAANGHEFSVEPLAKWGLK